jgi:hypothetical protein
LRRHREKSCRVSASGASEPDIACPQLRYCTLNSPITGCGEKRKATAEGDKEANEGTTESNKEGSEVSEEGI